jgi:hypothetical protein
MDDGVLERNKNLNRGVREGSIYGNSIGIEPARLASL